MNKNFNDGAGRDSSAKTNKASQKVYIIDIPDEDIVDNPNNKEDVSHTEDLELSIKENGFIDPLDVTDFGMESGKYMIVSGHRRRNAGKKLGMDSFPCIIRSFQSREEMINQMLLSQSFRDSSKNPLLYVYRYMWHEMYLKEIGFNGSIRKEIAKRMGLSIQQVDRYANVSKMIQPVRDAIERGTMTVSSAQPLASHEDEDQVKIMAIIDDALAQCHCVSLTREQVRDIVKAYDAGARDYGSVLAWEDRQETISEAYQEEIPFSQDNDFDDEYNEDKEALNDEYVQGASDESPRASRYVYDNFGDLEGSDDKRAQKTRNKGYKIKAETETEMRQKHTDSMFRVLKAVESALQGKYECRNNVEAGKLMDAYQLVVSDLIREMSNLADIMDMSDKWAEISRDIKEIIDACDNMPDLN